MSRRKSKLAKKRPIQSHGQLAADVNKFNRADNTYYREVVEADISPARQLVVIKTICGHQFLLTRDDLDVGMIWEDGVPSGVICDACRRSDIGVLDALLDKLPSSQRDTI